MLRHFYVRSSEVEPGKVLEERIEVFPGQAFMVAAADGVKRIVTTRKEVEEAMHMVGKDNYYQVQAGLDYLFDRPKYDRQFQDEVLPHGNC